MSLPQGLGFDDEMAHIAGEEIGFSVCVGGVGMGDAARGELFAEEGADI